MLGWRWPEGEFRCPRCGSGKSYPRPGRGGVECGSCSAVLSVRAGTLMHGSRLPLRTWLRAAWALATAREGFSALELQRRAGLSRYESALRMMRQIRRGMGRAGRVLLGGKVEVGCRVQGHPRLDSSDLGGDRGVAVLGAVHAGSKRWVRLRCARRLTRTSLRSFLEDSVAPGSLVVTPRLAAYEGLERWGYRHRPLPARGRARSALPPLVAGMFAEVDDWLARTYRTALSRRHVQGYLDEFAYRRNSEGQPGALLPALLGILPPSP